MLLEPPIIALQVKQVVEIVLFIEVLIILKVLTSRISQALLEQVF